MKERHDHPGWQLFKIASISITPPANAPVAAGSDDRKDTLCFMGKIWARGADESLDYTQLRVQDRADYDIKIPLTFNAEVVIEGDGPIDLHLRLDEQNWDEAMRRAKYMPGSGVDTLVFGYKVLSGDIEAESI